MRSSIFSPFRSRYAVSGERTLEAFYEHLQPFAAAFMALFGRDRLPARSTLSRFLAALNWEAVEALRMLFLEDLLRRQPDFEQQLCGLTDRAGNLWKVFDIDGTREAARQRARPQGPSLPLPQRRLDEVCAPGYTGRKRGEMVRTRTTVLQAHSYQWLGSFGNPGNGEYRKELRRAVKTIESYLRAHQFPENRALLRLDGLYGTGAVLTDLLGLPFVMRCKAYGLLDLPVVQTRLHLRGSINSSPYRKVLWSAHSMTALMFLWGQTGNSTASWWQRIRKDRRSSALGSNEMG